MSFIPPSPQNTSIGTKTNLRASDDPTEGLPRNFRQAFKHEYVRMQEVARTTDHAPSRTNYLWKVHLPSVISKMKRELSETFVNLKTKHIKSVKYMPHLLKLGAPSILRRS